MRYKVILIVFLFTEGEGGQDESTIQGWAFFTIENINNDLMKLQHGLIDNNTSGPRKMMSYFMRNAEHDN
jgi:hypothetical protein